MTAMLKDLRALKAARDRGDISPEGFARAQARLLDRIEDAVIDGAPNTAHPKPPTTEPKPPNERAATAPARLWETALLVVAACASVTLLLALMIGDLTLALTLLVTVIAAISVRAVKTLDE